MDDVSKAKKTLEEAGYFTDNLWQIDDVKGNYECADDEAMEILSTALQNEATMEQIWLAIDYAAADYNLKKLND